MLYRKEIILFLLIVWGISGNSSVYSQERKFQEKNVESDPYGLTFSEKAADKWLIQMSLTPPNAMLFWADKEQTDGKTPMRIGRFPFSSPKNFTLDVSMSQKITLPVYDCKVALLSLSAKGHHLKKAVLHVQGLGIKEEILYCDSISVNTIDEWKTFILEMPLQNIFYLRINISTLGIRGEESASLYLDRMEILLDGKNINDFPKEKNVGLESFDSSVLFPFTSVEDKELEKVIKKMPPFKILGLAETMYGCSSMQALENQVVKHLVSFRNCKLVLVELPAAVVLKWDFYIQGGNVDLKDIREEMALSLMNTELKIELLNWLRDYNSRASQKVKIVGISPDDKIMFALYYDYLYFEYQQCPNSFLKQTLLTIPDNIPGFFKNVGRIDSLFPGRADEFQAKWFHKMAFTYLHEGRRLDQAGVIDSLLAAHSFMALDFGLGDGETAVLICHWAHLNKLDIMKSKRFSLGALLEQKYGNECPIWGVVGGEGKVNKMKGLTIQEKEEISAALPGSFEEFGMQSKHSFFYMPSCGLPAVPLKLRIYLNKYNVSERWEDFAVRERMDGILFVRHCEGWDIPDGLPRAHMPYDMLLGSRFKRALLRKQEIKADIN